jgi:SAM-dependent methyltransferase
MSSYQRQLQTDLQRLENMLRRVAGGQAQGSDGSTTRILDLACGACNEAETLANFFGHLNDGAPLSSGKKVELLGIDVRAREIADAKRRFVPASHARPLLQKDYQFLTGDATKLDGHRAPDNHFDVVFMRHQNFWNGDTTWLKIFEQALAKLKTGGQLVITSYFDREHRLALEAIQKLGGQLVDSQRNPESRELPTPGKSVDRHVAVFQRQD